ncbi:uncharacterized protein PRCAT00002995001 [Priceomyces carsonii]|uniref:uncharacterized protein n=1 Tax=Priceomyces carsonii TaxID=28549 RepID=UPI002EDAC820|nr:unnamed protein product [Priceomyces carsonii]
MLGSFTKITKLGSRYTRNAAKVRYNPFRTQITTSSVPNLVLMDLESSSDAIIGEEVIEEEVIKEEIIKENVNFIKVGTSPKLLLKLSQINRELLDDYFENNVFHFPPDLRQRNIQYLKDTMSKVYVRDRPLLSIDIEAWERNHNKITEVGIGIYDPADLVNSIIPNVKSIHLLVKEHIRMKNGNFVPDNKSNPLSGISYELSLRECAQFMQAIIRNYLIEANGVLVGHNILGDIKWLKSMGVEFPSDLHVIDTATLYKITKTTGGSLRGILRLVSIPHGYLHNAANDAYYTLIAAIAYCDPNIRRTFELDHYKSSEMAPSTSNSSKRRDKFSDRSTIITYNNGANLFRDLIKK